MLPIILCLFEGLNDLRLVYNDCEKIYFITFVKVGVAIYNDHTVPYCGIPHVVLLDFLLQWWLKVPSHKNHVLLSCGTYRQNAKSTIKSITWYSMLWYF